MEADLVGFLVTWLAEPHDIQPVVRGVSSMVMSVRPALIEAMGTPGGAEKVAVADGSLQSPSSLVV